MLAEAHHAVEGGRAGDFAFAKATHDHLIERFVADPIDFVHEDDEHLHRSCHTRSFVPPARIHESAGSANSVRNSVEHSPPTTTVASGRCTSDPTPVALAAGTIPSMATITIISTGRIWASAP